MSEVAQDSEVDEQREQEERFERLDQLGLSLAEKRSRAIEGRDLSGIEREWIEDEEHYEGVDDANRGEMSAWHSKPVGQAALEDNEATGSTIFLNITRPYTDAAAARVGDMLLPTDDKGWKIEPTPIPSLSSVADGNIPMDMQEQIEKQYTDEQGNVDNEGMESRAEALVLEANEKLEEAREMADKAQKQIEDWHVECQYQAHMREVIEDAARLGTGVLKGPVPQKQTSVAFRDNEMVMEEKTIPASCRVDPWNCYPDPGCGQNIHNGDFFWERDEITPTQLQRLIGVRGYLDEQIDLCLEEGPTKATKVLDKDQDRHRFYGLAERPRENLYEIWYFHGRIEREDMELAGQEIETEDRVINAKLTMVNNHVIRATVSHLDNGDFPYDFMVWQKRKNMPWGIGVPRQIRAPQRIVNGAVRNMMDNAGEGGGPQMIVNRGLVEPENNIWEITPRKIWVTGTDAPADADLTKAFMFVTAPILVEQLQAIINMGLKFAEDVTGLPLLMQGQQGQAPETVGGMQLLHNNASTVLRRLARLFDDLITEPHIRRYYQYLMQYGEDDQKGDFQINAQGSSALVERDLQNQAIQQMAQIVMNPAFGLDPKKWVRELLKSQKLDVSRFEFDDQRWESIVQQLAQQKPPQMAIEELKANVKKFEAELKAQVQMAEQQSKQEMAEQQNLFQAAMKEVDVWLEEQRQAGNREIKLDEIKGKITETVLKLQTQKELSGTEALEPPVEPKGHAPDGESFEK